MKFELHVCSSSSSSSSSSDDDDISIISISSSSTNEIELIDKRSLPLVPSNDISNYDIVYVFNNRYTKFDFQNFKISNFKFSKRSSFYLVFPFFTIIISRSIAMAPKTRKSNSSSKKKAASAAKRGKKKTTTTPLPSSPVVASTLESTVPSLPPFSPVQNENVDIAVADNSIDFSSAAAVSNLISTTNVFEGETSERISKLQLNTVKYTSSVTGVVNHFFKILSSHPTLKHLADEVQDPDASEGTMEFRLVILARGTKNHDKYKILNTSLLVAAMNIKLQKHKDVDLTKR